MEKKLPKVFANKIDKKLSNNANYFVSNKSIQFKENDINKKINQIFSSNNYIYKIETIITLKSGEINKKIVGKNKYNLITIDNELIPIDDIIDIKINKKEF